MLIGHMYITDLPHLSYGIPKHMPFWQFKNNINYSLNLKKQSVEFLFPSDSNVNSFSQSSDKPINLIILLHIYLSVTFPLNV